VSEESEVLINILNNLAIPQNLNDEFEFISEIFAKFLKNMSSIDI